MKFRNTSFSKSLISDSAYLSRECGQGRKSQSHFHSVMFIFISTFFGLIGVEAIGALIFIIYMQHLTCNNGYVIDT